MSGCGKTFKHWLISGAFHKYQFWSDIWEEKYLAPALCLL